MTADCEANYARICRLLPALLPLAERGRREASAGTGRLDFSPLQRELLVELAVDEPARLLLIVEEQSRYTTMLTIEMSYVANCTSCDSVAGTPEYSGGSMSVRMYHDLRLAEVISVCGQRISLASYEFPNASMFQPDEKAQQNHFLAELLSLSIQKGLFVDTDSQLNLAEIFSPDVDGLCAASSR